MIRLRVVRSCTCFGLWREVGEVVQVHALDAAVSMVKTGRAAPADDHAARQLAGRLAEMPSTRAAKRAAWLEWQGRRAAT